MSGQAQDRRGEIIASQRDDKIAHELWEKYLAETAQLRETGIHLPHSFQNLRSFFNLPHNRYRSTLICDPSHQHVDLDFLWGPFFNIAILGQTRRTILHEISTSASAHFKKLATAGGSSNEDEVKTEFLKFLHVNGYPNINHYSNERMFQNLADSVAYGGRCGVNILPNDIREKDYLLDIDPSVTDEKERRIKNIGTRLSFSSYYSDLHKEVFGFDFPYGRDQMKGIISSILHDDLELSSHRFADTAMVDRAFSEANGGPFALVIGIDHTSGPMVGRIKELTGFDPVRLEVSFWGKTTNMVRQIYLGQEATPVYAARSDEIVYYPPDLPRLVPAKIQEFKQRVLASVDAKPITALASPLSTAGKRELNVNKVAGVGLGS